MEDSASFLLTANFLGVAHPPGYPLFTILAKAFTLIPVANVAYRVHLLNSLLGSFSVVFVYLLSFRFTLNKYVSFFVGVILLLSASFWFQAITAEVYMLNTFLFLVLLLFAFRLEKQFSNRNWYLFSFVYGLSLSNHWPLLILSSPGFVLLFWKERNRILRQIPITLLVLGLGLMPYLHLYFSKDYTEFFFYGKLDSISLVWEHIIRKEQWQMDVIQTAGVKQSLKLFLDFLLFPTSELPFVYMAFVYGGVYIAYQKLEKRIFYSLVLFFISSPFLLLFSFRTEYNQFTAEMFRYWHLIPISIGVLFVSFSFQTIYEFLGNKIEIGNWGKKIATVRSDSPQAAARRHREIKLLFIVISILGLILLAWEFNQNYAKNNLREDYFARDYARLVLGSLPENSVFFTNTDTDLGGQIGYVHFVENFRPDIKLTSQAAALFPERYFNRKDENDIRKKQVLFLNFFSKYKESGRRIFTTREITAFNEQFVFPLKYKQYGFYLEILEPEEVVNSVLSTSSTIEQSISFLNHYGDGKYKEHWIYYRNFAAQSVCHFLLLNQLEHPIFQTNRWCKLLKAQIANVREKDYRLADKLFLEILREALDDIYIFEKISIHRQFLLNRIHWTKDDSIPENQKRILLQDAANFVFPVLSELEFCNNPLAKNLKELHQTKLISIDIDYLNKTFPACPR